MSVSRHPSQHFPQLVQRPVFTCHGWSGSLIATGSIPAMTKIPLVCLPSPISQSGMSSSILIYFLFMIRFVASLMKYRTGLKQATATAITTPISM